MDEHCRLCSTRTTSLIEIFGETGLSHDLNEKINQRLQIFVAPEDFLSKSVCFNCCGRLDRYNQFVKSVHTAQATLQKQTTDMLKQNKVIKEEDEHVIDTIEIDDDVQPVTSSCCNNTIMISQKPSIESIDNQTKKGDCHVSVIRYETIHSNNNIDQTRPLNISPLKPKEIVCKDEMKYVKVNGESNRPSEPTNEIMDESDFFDKNSDDAEDLDDSKIISKSKIIGKTPKRLQSNFNDKQLNPREMKKKYTQVQKVQRKDFSAQIGNTLLSDLRGLKNSLLLRKIKAKNATVLTIPVPVLPNTTSSVENTFSDTSTSKGCQTEILLGAKSESRGIIVYQKISFEGRSFLEIGSESDAVITSTLPT